VEVLDPDGLVDAWMVTADHDAAQAMLTWLRAVAQGPELLSSAKLRHAATGREVYAAQVPGARCVVTYWWSAAPMRFVRIVKLTPIWLVAD
jgi:hypothetical protein